MSVEGMDDSGGIELRGVAKAYGPSAVLVDLDLAVPAGSLTAILGASGSGKTTLLRLIAGFERLDAGSVAIDRHVVDDGRRTVRSQDRGVGYVPQDGALFPHLTALGNVGFGLPRRERPAARDLLELVGLAGLERRYPHQLSGGQQQRVALARALAIKPAVLLLDEPFSSLDASLRVDLRDDVARIIAATGVTTILVTHDRGEALALADQIAVLGEGRVLACADPRALYREPADILAAASLGEVNLLRAEVRGERAECALGVVDLKPNGWERAGGGTRLLLRPEQIVLHTREAPGLTAATVGRVRFQGHDELADLTLDHIDGEKLLARVSGELAITPGQKVWVEATGPGHVLGPEEIPSRP
jgi:iron(III) transport system ATP-binding protein